MSSNIVYDMMRTKQDLKNVGNQPTSVSIGFKSAQ